jgi:hypothetical protein
MSKIALYRITLNEDEHELLVRSLEEYLTGVGNVDRIRELVHLLEKVDDQCEMLEREVKE